MSEFVDLDGKKHKISLTKYTKQHQNKSGPHLAARELIHDIFPFDKILEEVALPIGRKQTLYADFLIISRHIMIEVHGQQHFDHIYHFHKTKADFWKAKARDASKVEWCRINNIKLIILSYDNEDNWEKLIREQI